jgi:hypothetical protein
MIILHRHNIWAYGVTQSGNQPGARALRPTLQYSLQRQLNLSKCKETGI